MCESNGYEILTEEEKGTIALRKSNEGMLRFQKEWWGNKYVEISAAGDDTFVYKAVEMWMEYLRLTGAENGVPGAWFKKQFAIQGEGVYFINSQKYKGVRLLASQGPKWLDVTDLVFIPFGEEGEALFEEWESVPAILQAVEKKEQETDPSVYFQFGGHQLGAMFQTPTHLVNQSVQLVYQKGGTYHKLVLRIGKTITVELDGELLPFSVETVQRAIREAWRKQSLQSLLSPQRTYFDRKMNQMREFIPVQNRVYDHLLRLYDRAAIEMYMRECDPPALTKDGVHLLCILGTYVVATSNHKGCTVLYIGEEEDEAFRLFPAGPSVAALVRENFRTNIQDNQATIDALLNKTRS